MVFLQTHTPCAGCAFVAQVHVLVGFGILFLGDGWGYFTGVATVIGLMSGVGVGPINIRCSLTDVIS
jgi:hypothetical protein